MKRLLAMLLVGTMVFGSLAGCGGSEGSSDGSAAGSDSSSETTAEAPEEAKTYGEDETLQIAYIGWGFADETALMYTKSFDMVSENFNVEYTLSDAWGNSTSAEDVVEVLPSLIEAGAQAVIVHSMSARIVEICNEAGVYFTLSGEVILDEELQAMCDASPYYVGTVALADYDGGYALGEYLANDGCENVAYLRESTRNLEENRLQGATTALDEYGVTMVGEYCGREDAQALRDFVASNPDLDGVIISNGTNGKLDTAAQTLESLGVQNDIDLVSICSPVGHEAYFENGTVNMIMAGEGFEPMICSMLLVNAMRGNRIDEEPFLDYVSYFPIEDASEIATYSTYFSSESELLPVTAEQLTNDWLKENNPDLNNEWISNWLDTEYNLDAIVAAHENA